MCGQMCMLVIDVAGAIKYTRFILGTITAFYGAPNIAPLLLWLLVLLCSYTIVCCMGVLLLTVVCPRVVVKNYTKRWRRLVRYGGQNYRTILFSFAWLFQARPLYIVVFFVGMWTISRLTLSSPMKPQLDLMEIVRDLRHGTTIINLPIPHVILLGLCNLLTGATSWRMVLSSFTISVWCFNYHFKENYCKVISPALTIILA